MINRISNREFKSRMLSLGLLNSQTSKVINTPWQSRIDIYPHQIETAIKAMKNLPVKLILADEVGLGKTIEAGLILKELIARNEVDNFIVFAPASLVNQWNYELFSKFDISTTIIKGNNKT